MKNKILLLAKYISYIWELIPENIRRKIIFGLLVLESRNSNSNKNLKRLFKILDDLHLVINEQSMIYGNSEHPKHYLTNYHQFFIANIGLKERVIDVGCGYGAVARSVATAIPTATITAVDFDPKCIEQAKEANNPANLEFVLADAVKNKFSDQYDTIILSNVLEHISERVDFLKKLIFEIKPRKVLIRVPLFERHWHIPMRKNLEMYYFSDPDHKIEHTIEEFKSEMHQSELQITSLKTIWGEIWAVCER